MKAKRVADERAKKKPAPTRSVSKSPALPHLRERWPRNERERKARAAEYYRRLSAMYPDAHCALDHDDPYQLLVATILSAQCTDKRVNMVTPDLFERYPGPGALADADQDELEDAIRSTGFFRNKTKSLLGMARAVVERHGGNIPDSMEELTQLPGVGRKTANVVLGNAFGKNIGIVVDTHVTRLSNRLGLTRETDAVKIEQDLMPLFPPEQWTMLSHLLIEHGRQICIARAPRCEACPLNDICPSSRV
jgi:endonuclease III